MKKGISILICCVLIFSSFSFSFAVDWSTTDQANLSNAASRLLTISNTLNNIYSALNVQGHTIAYWVEAINTWMSPIYIRLQDIILATTDPTLNAISGLLGYPTTDNSTGVTSYTSYLREIYNLDNVNGVPTTFTIYTPTSNGNLSAYNWSGGNNWRDSIVTSNVLLNDSLVRFYSNQYEYLASGFNSSQNLVNWLDLSNSSFTPTSSTDGIYKWLSNIQAPVARLAYVLASDERIEAQQAATANEQTVVDNFIDSSGNGSASTSDFSSLSSASDSFKTNFNSGASAGGIWDVFNSDHGNWFSQSIADSLDTSRSSNRNIKSGSSFETPLLDQQIEDIYKALGGDKK